MLDEWMKLFLSSYLLISLWGLCAKELIQKNSILYKFIALIFKIENKWNITSAKNRRTPRSGMLYPYHGLCLNKKKKKKP